MDELATICSMTGYAAIARELPHGSLNLELRSVNNRYLDIQFRVPDEFRLLEAAMRELLTGRLHRGKIDCRVGYSRLPGVVDPQSINKDLLQKLLELNRIVQTMLPEARSLEVADILRWPGILNAEQMPADDLRAPCMELLGAALDELTAARVREGEKLRIVLLERLRKMRQLASEVGPRIPALLAGFQEKLKGRLSEAMINCDDERVRQELTLFASKIDVDEELSRLNAHFDEVDRVLRKGGAIGKRLDFLMQELNREANTIGAKSVDPEVSRTSVELKVLIEQMREQVQNIE